MKIPYKTEINYNKVGYNLRVFIIKCIEITHICTK